MSHPLSPSPSEPSMRPSSPRSRLVTRGLLIGTCVVLMGGAFVAAATVDSPHPIFLPEKAAMVAPRARMAPQASTLGLMAKALPPVKSTAPAAAASSEASPVLMPDFKGKRLPAALREAKRLGLRLAVQDDTGYRPGAHESSYYRVRRQSVAAGDPLPSDQVKLTVRVVGETAEGY